MNFLRTYILETILPSIQIEAAVSSHEVSIPSTINYYSFVTINSTFGGDKSCQSIIPSGTSTLVHRIESKDSIDD